MDDVITAGRHWLPAIFSGLLVSGAIAIIAHVPLPEVETVHLAQPVKVHAPSVFIESRPARTLFPLPPQQLPSNGDLPPTTSDMPPVLTGIASGRGRAVALLKSGSGQTAILHSGETIDGWQVKAIASSQVMIERSDQRVTLSLSPSITGK